jgi:hypothetical protein
LEVNGAEQSASGSDRFNGLGNAERGTAKVGMKTTNIVYLTSVHFSLK